MRKSEGKAEFSTLSFTPLVVCFFAPTPTGLGVHISTLTTPAPEHFV